MSVAIPWQPQTQVQLITAVASPPTGAQCLGGPLTGAQLDFRVVNASTTLVATIGYGTTAAIAQTNAVTPSGTTQQAGCVVLGPLETAFISNSPATFWSATASSSTPVYVQGGMSRYM
jgi:hypothetical protein